MVVVDNYDYRNCQSLFGYEAAVHERSGGICQLCGSGGRGVDFDFWRQLTVEHLIGESQGGYLREIRLTLVARYSTFDVAAITAVARRIDTANTITACSFCNSTTSRSKAAISMTTAIEHAPDGTADEIHNSVTADLAQVLADERRDVLWKLESVRRAFDDIVEPRLRCARELEKEPR